MTANLTNVHESKVKTWVQKWHKDKTRFELLKIILKFYAFLVTREHDIRTVVHDSYGETWSWKRKWFDLEPYMKDD